MGHSRKVAAKHYWRVTDIHFAKATKAAAAAADQAGRNGGTDGGTKVAQTVAPTGHDTETTQHNKVLESLENGRELAGAGVSWLDNSVTPTE